MTEFGSHRDPVEELCTWIRRHPETWGEFVDDVTPDDVDRLVVGIVSGERAQAREAQHRRRRLRRVVAGAGLVVVLSAGAVAANLLGSGQPTQPNLLVACRAEADPRADAVVIDSLDDPIGGCAEQWATGEFRGRWPSAEGPPLVACISNAGVVEVYPGDAGVCSGLGYAEADPTLSPENQAIVNLNERVAADINAQPCASSEEVADRAERILAESGLERWSVSVSPGHEHAPCAKVALDATMRSLTVVSFPTTAFSIPSTEGPP